MLYITTIQLVYSAPTSDPMETTSYKTQLCVYFECMLFVETDFKNKSSVTRTCPHFKCNFIHGDVEAQRLGLNYEHLQLVMKCFESYRCVRVCVYIYGIVQLCLPKIFRVPFKIVAQYILARHKSAQSKQQVN
jgi:hypothetical protein